MTPAAKTPTPTPKEAPKPKAKSAYELADERVAKANAAFDAAAREVEDAAHARQEAANAQRG